MGSKQTHKEMKMKFKIIDKKEVAPIEIVKSIKERLRCSSVEALQIFKNDVQNSTPDKIFESWELYLALREFYELREINDGITELYLGKRVEGYSDEEINAANKWKDSLSEEEAKHLQIIMWGCVPRA